MNPYVFLAAAAAATVSTAISDEASAKKITSGTITFTGSDGSSYCDLMTITAQDKINVAEMDDLSACDEAFVSHGVGQMNKAKTADKSYATMGDNQAVYFGMGDTVQLEFSIEEPLVTGGSWVINSTSDGIHSSVVSQGTYEVLKGENVRANRGGPSIVGKIIAEDRAKRR
jgi:hypothetical protein